MEQDHHSAAPREPSFPSALLLPVDSSLLLPGNRPKQSKATNIQTQHFTSTLKRASCSSGTRFRDVFLGPYAWFLALVLAALSQTRVSDASDLRGRQFIAIDSFVGFSQTNGYPADERVLTSPEIKSRIPFDEMVVSWNVEASAGGYLIVEARAIYMGTATKYYQLGTWSNSSTNHNRRSAVGQKDADGDVKTDTLVLERAAEILQIRLRLGPDGTIAPKLKFLGVCLSDTTARPSPIPPERRAWDKLLAVPERTQMIYPNGKTLCSPTTVSMMMAFWAEQLKRPELDRTVPEVADAVYDSEWHGAGNWPFNMAYAGSFKSMRAYVARLSDVSELEQWIAEGIPVGLSVDYDHLRAKGPGPNGHLVVCVGFTKTGDPIINDPGTSQNVRKIFPRRNLIDAWGCSHNTVYFVYPEGALLPQDRFGHWQSPLTALRAAAP